ncbi:hypothetical protein [Planctopirus limnophila]|uniref:hypothetical protein n=1 Tax=Planctopirus limnophila TaxID=120 RepID=UPI001E5561EA|nr:hypothetical protein [Planctopirus limnophila]
MGTDTNVQKRLVALHHPDAPWRPAEVEQRDGRILRQCNDNEEISIYHYVTEGSFDAYMWQALETKARLIAQVMNGSNIARKAEDVGGQELSYAEVKAIASGNPAVLTLAEGDAELKRLSILQNNHHDEQFLARRNIKELPDKVRRLTQRIEVLEGDILAQDSSQDSFCEAMNWISETDKSQLVCANEQYYLLRSGSPVCWEPWKCDKFLAEDADLWENW